jgi:heat shock protein HslJ
MEPVSTAARQLAMNRLVTAIVVVAALAVLGCNPQYTPQTAAPVSLEGDWQLASGTVDGAPFPIVADSPITLSVQGTQIGGRAACNLYGGTLSVVDGGPRLSMTSMTEMACEEPVMAAEAAFIDVLPRIRGAARDGDKLTLTGEGVELGFERLAPPPVAELVGTEWVLESLVAGDAVSSVSGDRATLRFDPDGTVTGGTGCRTFSGKWVESNGGITLPEWGMDQTECPPALQSQDGHVAGVLEGFRVAIDGDQLTLSAERGSDGLIYRAAR